MKKKVLIIDDEGDLVEELVVLLRRKDFLVDVSLNGNSGLGKVASFQPDIIILDVLMPKMDGWEVCRRIRADPKTEKIPVIVLTGLKEPNLEKEIKAAGAQDFLLKPYSRETLLNKIRVCLQ